MEPVELTRWAAAISTIVAASSVAWGSKPRIVAWGFVLFTLASLLWIGAAIATGEMALLSQNAVLLGINLWGLWRWWGRT